MLTNNERWLLEAAKDAADYLNRISTGKPSRGMYEDLTVGRYLRDAIEAVEQDEKQAEQVTAC